MSNLSSIRLWPLCLLFATAVACTTEPFADEPTSSDEQEAGSGKEWVAIAAGGCATSLGVSPNNVLYVTGCDAGVVNKSVWRLAEEWSLTSGTGTRIGVDHAGLAEVIRNNGQPYFASVTSTDARHVCEATGAFFQNPPNSPCLADFEMYHLDNLLAGVTSNLPVANGDHHMFAVRCPTVGGNGLVMTRMGEFAQWVSTSPELLASQIALFTVSGSRRQILWMVDAAGVVSSYDEGDDFDQDEGRQVARPQPPGGPVRSLTDHFARTDGGVFVWNDAASTWSRVAPNSTPFGSITQIAHAGAVVITGIDGRRFTVGGSDLWGIDGTGTIYRALPQIR
jgi:hypothetical protein